MLVRKPIGAQRMVARGAATLLVAMMATGSERAYAQAATAPAPSRSGTSADTNAAGAAAAGGVEEIVVTAQKRSENAQNVPISIQAFNGATLRDANISQVQDLTKLVPPSNSAPAPARSRRATASAASAPLAMALSSPASPPISMASMCRARAGSTPA